MCSNHIFLRSFSASFHLLYSYLSQLLQSFSPIFQSYLYLHSLCKGNNIKCIHALHYFNDAHFPQSICVKTCAMHHILPFSAPAEIFLHAVYGPRLRSRYTHSQTLIAVARSLVSDRAIKPVCRNTHGDCISPFVRLRTNRDV